MSKRTRFIWAASLFFVGLAGLGITWALASAGVLSTSGGFASDGQRIYYTGTDASGRAIPRTITGGMMGRGMMAGIACVDCHREDGRGGSVGMMFGAVEAPDIRYSTLTKPRTEDDEQVPAWSDRDIVRAIRQGIEPNGERLRAPMPRWDMTNAEVVAVIAYLKELDSAAAPPVRDGGSVTGALGPVGVLLVSLFGAMVVVGLVLLIFAAQTPGGRGASAPSGPDEAVAIARRRLAAGEIDQVQYDEIVRTLGR